MQEKVHLLRFGCNDTQAFRKLLLEGSHMKKCRDRVAQKPRRRLVVAAGGSPRAFCDLLGTAAFRSTQDAWSTRLLEDSELFDAVAVLGIEAKRMPFVRVLLANVSEPLKKPNPYS